VVASDPRVTVVTGGGSGIGRATAIRLARRGDVLCLCDVSATGLKETAALVESERGRVLNDVGLSHPVCELGGRGTRA